MSPYESNDAEIASEWQAKSEVYTFNLSRTKNAGYESIKSYGHDATV